jgi:hypothetical protein
MVTGFAGMLVHGSMKMTGYARPPDHLVTPTVAWFGVRGHGWDAVRCPYGDRFGITCAVRFYPGTALLLVSEALITRLEELVERTEQRAEQEARRRKAVKQELAGMRAELDRLRR